MFIPVLIASINAASQVSCSQFYPIISTGPKTSLDYKIIAPDGSERPATLVDGTTDRGNYHPFLHGPLDGTAIVWDVKSEVKILELKTGDKHVYTVIYSPDDTQIATGGYKETAAKIWDAKTGEHSVEQGQRPKPGARQTSCDATYEHSEI
ncbi:hypothetical protein BDR03DRAFT_1009655 [Suillus americanus]|nr:hypothetical protein BDR03DRAFT_1009655 [Suillus americanus]